MGALGESLLLGAGSTLQGGVNALIGGAINDNYSKKMEERAWQRQMKLYEKQYNDNSPEARRKQLEDAGLSTSLMYGQTGAGGGAASGASAGQGSVDTRLDTSQLMAIENQKANIELMKANADKAKAEADKLRGADTDNTIADTAKKQAETTYQNIQNNIAKATEETVIETVKQGLMKLEEETNAIINNNEIVEASKEDLIKINANNAVNTGLDALLKKGEIKLNAQQIEKMKAEIVRMNAQTHIDTMALKNNILKNKWDVELKLDENKLKALATVIGADVEMVKSAMNLLGNIVGGGLIAAGTRGLAKGQTTTTTQTTKQPVYNTNTGQVEYREITTKSVRE